MTLFIFTTTLERSVSAQIAKQLVVETSTRPAKVSDVASNDFFRNYKLAQRVLFLHTVMIFVIFYFVVRFKIFSSVLINCFSFCAIDSFAYVL